MCLIAVLNRWCFQAFPVRRDLSPPSPEGRRETRGAQASQNPAALLLVLAPRFVLLLLSTDCILCAKCEPEIALGDDTYASFQRITEDATVLYTGVLA